MWSYRKLESRPPVPMAGCDFPRLQESAGRVAARALGAVDTPRPNRQAVARTAPTYFRPGVKNTGI